MSLPDGCFNVMEDEGYKQTNKQTTLILASLEEREPGIALFLFKYPKLMK